MRSSDFQPSPEVGSARLRARPVSPTLKVMSRRPPSSTAPATPPPCVHDTSSVAGLRALVRKRPSDWNELLARGAPDARLHPYVVVADVVGTRADVAALPKGPDDLGRLRGARWAASVLRRNAGGLGLLAVSERTAEALETTLIKRRGIAPSSARKVRAHLLQLRASVARQLGVVPAPVAPPASPPALFNPRLDLASYREVTERLSPSDRLACDLVLALRLRPATVLRLEKHDVAPEGRAVVVRGRHLKHRLPVPAFLRQPLADAARGGEPSEPLFPGRDRARGLSPTTLRRRFRRAAHEVIGEDRHLRDLSDLGTATLGPGSATPRGREVVLRRVADRWSVATQPPSLETSTPTLVPQAPREPLAVKVAALEALLEEVTRSLRAALDANQQQLRALDARTAAQRNAGRQLREDLDALKRGLQEAARAPRRAGQDPNAEQRKAFAETQRQVTRLVGEVGRSRRALAAISPLVIALTVDRASQNNDPTGEHPQDGQISSKLSGVVEAVSVFTDGGWPP